MINEVRIKAPMRQVIEVPDARYDREWKTYFLPITVTEEHPKDSNPISELVTICLNDKADAERLISLIRKATRKIK